MVPFAKFFNLSRQGGYFIGALLYLTKMRPSHSQSLPGFFV